ncbi:MAG: FkbM family methyltransferase [Alphaproteobacteria bacterium]|nr:FkbM family methyltransferase [Alphaproteobacteria bacterium]
MTLQRPADFKNLSTPDTFKALLADRVYYICKKSHLFGWMGSRIVKKLPRFDGVVVIRRSEHETRDVCERLGVETTCIEQLELLKLANTHKITLVDFSEDLFSMSWCKKLAEHPNITRCDFMQAYFEVNEAIQLYKPLQEERAFVIDNLQAYDRIYDRLTDDLSKRTLMSWLQVMLNFDRTPLYQTRMPQEMEYMNALFQQASIIPKKDEVYVDVGAANGDTVHKFLNASRMQYKKIVALEPHEANYNALLNIQNILPNFFAYRYLAGDKEDLVSFYNNPHTPEGSNALMEGNTVVKQVKLDDLVPDATFIKMDVEGYETSVLRGAANTIKANKPNMAVTTYHYARDFLNIIATMDEIHKYKYIALRQPHVNMHDFSYYFSDTQSFA